MFNALEPNPTIAARAVFPQSGLSPQEKLPIFAYFCIFFQIEHHIKTQIKANEKLCKMQLQPLRFHIVIHFCRTLNLGIHVSGNLVGTFKKNRKNHGEITHV